MFVLVMLISISAVSFAHVFQSQRKEFPDIDNYIGIWYGAGIYDPDARYSMTIGQIDGDYRAFLITFYGENNATSFSSYYLTYDNDASVMYFTITEEAMTYKVKFEGGQLVVYNVPNNNRLIVKLDKVNQ